jgi:hypothetical protein
MSVYSKEGEALAGVYSKAGEAIPTAYDINGIVIYQHDVTVDYDNYSYAQKWASKGVGSTQGYDIYDHKVFWVSKSGNSSVPANCYVWNLSDGSQALDTAYITVYSGHGNNLCFDFPTLYATSAYTPNVYINDMTPEFVATLNKTLYIPDGCKDCDACIDETNKQILWTVGHAQTDSTSNPVDYILSQWNLANLTDNGDGTYTPGLIKTITTPRPPCYYFQGVKMHDGILWYASGYPGSHAYVYGVSPSTGELLHTIDLATTAEPEGVAWYPDAEAIGGYALYVGFQGMMMRKYTFGELV